MNIITYKLNYVLINNKTLINTSSSNNTLELHNHPWECNFQISWDRAVFIWKYCKVHIWGKSGQWCRNLLLLSYTTFNFSPNRNNFYQSVYTCTSVSTLQAPGLWLSLHNGNNIHPVKCFFCNIKMKFINVSVLSHPYSEHVYFYND